jgi:hypothetical protein
MVSNREIYKQMLVAPEWQARDLLWINCDRLCLLLRLGKFQKLGAAVTIEDNRTIDVVRTFWGARVKLEF